MQPRSPLQHPKKPTSSAAAPLPYVVEKEPLDASQKQAAIARLGYNTQKKPVAISEYGRNIQTLLYHINEAIEPYETRYAYVEAALRVMRILDPQAKVTEDGDDKLWAHAFQIFDFTGSSLRLEPPPNVVAILDKDPANIPSMPYPPMARTYRHYGVLLQRLIQKAQTMPEGETRIEMVQAIAQYMKVAQKTFNREGIEDAVIRQDLARLSGGSLELENDATITDISEMGKKKRRRRKKKGSDEYLADDPSTRTSRNPQSAAAIAGNKAHQKAKMNSRDANRQQPQSPNAKKATNNNNPPKKQQPPPPAAAPKPAVASTKPAQAASVKPAAPRNTTPETPTAPIVPTMNAANNTNGANNMNGEDVKKKRRRRGGKKHKKNPPAA